MEQDLEATSAKRAPNLTSRRFLIPRSHPPSGSLDGDRTVLHVQPTADIDASYADPDTVHAVVADMAADFDLAPGWLNTKAAAFVPDNAT